MLKIIGLDEENKLRFTKSVDGDIVLDEKSDVSVTREYFNLLIEHNLSPLLFNVDKVVFENEENAKLTFNVCMGFMSKDYKLSV